MKYLLLLILFFRLLLVNAQFQPDSLTFYFDFNSDKPNGNSIDIEKIKSLKGIKDIQIFAYTDTVGSIEYNQKLAERRAESVTDLAKTTFKRATISIDGESSDFGSDEMNRRVDVKFLSPMEGKMIREVSNLDIKFVGNQDIVLPKSYGVVDELVAKIKADTYTKIEIHGHVCCRPDQILSEKRALAIKNILVENGVEESIITTFGHSNSQPLVREFTEVDFEKNRRVEVVLIRSSIEY
jgi:outer membrane protein OmpA-like peptidoglycan-associated protein|tara:strand:+ start:7794 stop:8510 length:717 start_codon:yes stop_codon:yes gene_type:complete